MWKIGTNFFEFQLSKGILNVPFVTYESKEQLANLRKAMPNSYLLHSKDEIYFWGNEELKPNGYRDLTVLENKYIYLKILKESVLRQFYQDKQKYDVHKSFHVHSITLNNLDLSKCKFEGLSLYKTFHLHFVPFQIGSKTTLGLTVSMSVTEKVQYKVDDFKKAGIYYEDLRFDEESGKVFNNAKSKFRLAQFFKYESELKKQLDELNAIQNELQEISTFIDVFFKNKLNTFCFPDDLKIASISTFSFNLNKNEGDFQNRILDKPEHYYYKGKYPQNTNNFPNRRKIAYNKPFTYDEFENKQINISLIYPKNNYKEVATFFKHVQEELTDTFKIDKHNFKYSKFEIEGFQLRSYQQVLVSVSKSKPDLVVVIIDESHEALDVENSPYFFCKSKFIEQGINTQEIQIQQIHKFLVGKKADSANYTDHNLALNIYAKLGGMAWTVKPHEPKNELIFGIGATTDREGQPVLGLTSVFRGDGKYLFGKVSSVSNMENYQESLEQIVYSTIKNNIEDGTLETDKTFYIVFHIFKPAGKDNEIKALENVIKKFKNYSFQYAFVHIGDGHNYRFYTFQYNGKNLEFDLKGNLGQNRRGTLVRINDNFAFLGLRPSSSTFTKVIIDSRSNFIDIEYITMQVYQFAEMSHTSYNKSGTPITIKYPNLMAYFAQKLNEINGFYLDEISMPDNSLWFI